MRIITALGAILGLACFSNASAAGERVYVVPTDASVVNHWPSADQLIGTPDDVVSGSLSANAQSSPNQDGSYAYLATYLGFMPHNNPDPMLFGTNNAITFVQGSVGIDPTTFVTNGVPQLSSLQFSGTELFPGHGPYSVKLTNRRGGQYQLTGNVIHFTCDYDFDGTFVAGPATATNAHTVGTIVLIDSKDFDNPALDGLDASLGNYVQSVAVPVAKAKNARGLICGVLDLQTSGSIAGTTGYFPPLVARGVVLALDLSLAISSVEWTPQGPRIRWTNPGGKPLSIEAADALDKAFESLATNLTGSEYIDTSTQGRLARYYRLRQQ